MPTPARPSGSTDQLADALQLLGVVGQQLDRQRQPACGRSTCARASVRLVWPESEHAGIRGMGRGVVAGNEVFWPTRNEIYVHRRPNRAHARGRRSASAPVSDCGANLAAADGRLIVAGYDKLLAFGPPAPPPDAKQPKMLDDADSDWSLKRPVQSRTLVTSQSDLTLNPEP